MYQGVRSFETKQSGRYENERRIRPLATSTPDKLIVVENWFEELKAKSRK